MRLQLHVLAYNMGNFLRTLALPDEIEHWSMTTMRAKVWIIEHTSTADLDMKRLRAIHKPVECQPGGGRPAQEEGDAKSP